MKRMRFAALNEFLTEHFVVWSEVWVECGICAECILSLNGLTDVV